MSEWVYTNDEKTEIVDISKVRRVRAMKLFDGFWLLLTYDNGDDEEFSFDTYDDALQFLDDCYDK